MKESEFATNQELDFERIRILFGNLNFGYTAWISAIAILYFVAERYSTPELALGWVLLAVAANVPRIILSILFARRTTAGRITKFSVKPWEYYITATNAVAYVGLVAVIFLPYGDHTIIGVMICAFVFMLMAVGGVLVLTTSLPSIVMYISMAMLAIVGRFVLLHDKLYIILAGILVLGYLQLLRLIIGQNRLLVENIALKIENSQFALVDPLTKLGNRRRLLLHVDKLIPSAQRSGEPFCLILLDIDHFKQYNDVNGHGAGDEVLVHFADFLLKCSREQDLVVRYGGEEFLLVLPQTEIRDAAVIAERIRTTVKEGTDVTVSAGVAEYTDRISFQQLVDQADEALYAAKSGGRDRYVLAAPA
jgi:diguanylate cyclase (GGDEF)-like protein